MSLRPSELAQVVTELSERLAGALVQKAWVPLPRLAYLEVRVPGRSALLCLCAEGELARVSLAAERFPSPGEPAPFQRWLRGELTGLKLAGVAWRDAERAVHLTLAREGAPGRTLVLELGAPGGLVLVSDTGRVLMTSGEGLAQRRGLWPGTPYTAPEAMDAAALARARATPSRLSADAAPAGAPGAALAPLAEAAEALLGPRDRSARAESIRRRLAQPYRARLKRAARTLEKVQAEASRGDDAEAHRALGELLTQNLHLLKRGQAEARLTRWTEAGAEEVQVKLDPRRGPREEAEWHFHQYRRLLRGVDQARGRVGELEREVRTAREALAQLEAMDEAALLAQVEVLQGPADAAGPPQGRPFKEYLGHGGQRIWVGRGAADNDALTFQVARPFHLWLHVRGSPGSHVVVPLAKDQAVTPEVLLDAAHLALHHSGLKGEPRGEVAYVPVKFVKKPKGGAPGAVLYTREKSLLLRVEPERLQRLLKAQVDAGGAGV